MATLNKCPGITSFATPAFPRYNDAVVLGTAAAEDWVVPSGVGWVIIEPTGAVWANVLATAVVPTTEIADGSAPVRISTPFQVRVAYGETISFIREGGSSVTVSLACFSV